MSDSRRRLPWGNAAFVVPVQPDDFANEDAEPALRGIVYQETVEREAFARGASTYAVPAQRLSDFLGAQATQELPQERSCARAVPADLSEILPAHVVHTLRKMLPAMLAELNGVRRSDVLLYGPETRTSSPVRVVRDPISRQSAAVAGLFVAGEGAGYAGGIVSSAIDGIATARAMVRSRTSR
ncbi:MAG TPA: hypothetical protein ENN96_00985 [Candidatus Acetothermia bacterium]|nr:hypothetical protein [Candidatus Acetothermia bacterium]